MRVLHRWAARAAVLAPRTGWPGPQAPQLRSSRGQARCAASVAYPRPACWGRIVQPVHPAGDPGELRVGLGHHRRLVAQDVRRQRQGTLEHQPHRVGRGGDEAVVDRHLEPTGQRVISHTVNSAINTQTVAPT